MSQQTGTSLQATAFLALAFGVAAFGVALAVGGYDLTTSAFMGLLVAFATGVVFFFAFAGSRDQMPVPGHDARPAAPPPAPPAPAAKQESAAAPPAAPAAAPAKAAGAASRPAPLSAPRGGKADDLKAIVGIGPKLEQLCHRLGYFHFDQIAAWTAEEVAWVDENLEGFRGRVTRDKWVEQAKKLAKAGKS